MSHETLSSGGGHDKYFLMCVLLHALIKETKWNFSVRPFIDIKRRERKKVILIPTIKNKSVEKYHTP